MTTGYHAEGKFEIRSCPDITGIALVLAGVRRSGYSSPVTPDCFNNFNPSWAVAR